MNYKVLFDHNIRQHALRGEYGIDGSLKDYPPKKGWLQQEIECFEEISELCKVGIITPYISEELLAEDRVQKFPSPSYKDTFDSVEFLEAKCVLVRSKWGICLERYHDKEDVINYCKSFWLKTTEKRQERFIKGMLENPRFSLSDIEEKSLRNTSVFRAICHGIAETHYPDALHLFTAEMNDLDFFLTTDKKFKNVADRQNVSLNCRILLPSTLLTEIRASRPRA